MKKMFLIGSILAYCGQAIAQPVEYTFKVTGDELNIISEALIKEPFNKVVGLIGKLRQQIVEQQQPKPPIKQEEPEKK